MCHEQLSAALAQLTSVAIDRLNLDQIVEFRKRNRTAIEDLAQQIASDADAVMSSMAAGDPSAFQTAKRLSTKHQIRAEYLVTLDESLSDAYQRRFMEMGMAERLGGPRALMLAERLILALIVLVLGLLVYDFIAGPDESRPALLTSSWIFAIDTGCCIIFMSEFMLRLLSADSKPYVWKHHWIDFITSIPIPGEAQLVRFGRLARLARFARLLRLLRFARLFFYFWRGLDKLQDLMDVKVMKKTMRWAVFATIAGAILIYKIEGQSAQDNDNAVSTFGKSVWWSFTTVLTGGFGDIHNPDTITGQMLTGVLVVIGMVLVGVFTATLTSIFIGERQDNEDVRLDQIAAKLEAISLQTRPPTPSDMG